MDSNKFGVAKEEKDYSKSDGEDNQNGDGNKVKRKRRSKNEQEGRSYKCQNCGKSYLSQPALTNHNKTKHHLNDPSYIKRGRGRPRKNPTFNGQPEKDIQKFKLFFNKEERRKNDSEDNDFAELCKEALQDLMTDFKGKIFLKYNSVDELPFFKELVHQYNNKDNPYEKTNCDQIFASYVIEYFPQTNRSYFVFLVKFVTLFRECINHFKTIEDSETEFSQINSADGVPDLCNEFITEFMENNDNFKLETTELIEIIQHFCNWLYDNKFTTSRLTLLS